MTASDKTPGKTPGQIAYEADEQFENIPWWNRMDSTKQNYEHIAAAVRAPLLADIEKLKSEVESLKNKKCVHQIMKDEMDEFVNRPYPIKEPQS